ncbi:MAG: hypothetical protein K1X29_06390 [Bdellovibrionales bacterium]|nr:hypothetical protein [Bdellovibrionales bacterium]
MGSVGAAGALGSFIKNFEVDLRSRESRLEREKIERIYSTVQNFESSYKDAKTLSKVYKNDLNQMTKSYTDGKIKSFSQIKDPELRKTVLAAVNSMKFWMISRYQTMRILISYAESGFVELHGNIQHELKNMFPEEMKLIEGKLSPLRDKSIPSAQLERKIISIDLQIRDMSPLQQALFRASILDISPDIYSKLFHEPTAALLNKPQLPIRSSSETREKSKFVGGIKVAQTVGSLLTPMVFELGENLINKNQLLNCQKNFNLSERDVSFLNGKSYLFNKSKVMANGIFSACEDLKLVDPEKTAQDYINIYQVLSPGVCNLITNEQKRLDRLLDNNIIPTKKGCDKYQDETITFDPKLLTIEYSTLNGKKVDAKWNSLLNWIDYTSANVKNMNGSKDYEMTERMHMNHDVSGKLMSGQTNALRDQARLDMESSCHEDSSFDTMDCRFLKSLVRVRVYFEYYLLNCKTAELFPISTETPSSTSRTSH